MSFDLVGMIGQVGFPIAVTIFLLYERHKMQSEKENKIAGAIDRMTESQRDLKGTMGEFRIVLKAMSKNCIKRHD